LDFSGSDLVGGIIESFAAVVVGGGGDRVRAELERRSRMLAEARTIFADRKSEMFGGDKQEAFDGLKKLERALADAWAEWRSQKAEDRRAKHEAWVLRTEERIEKNEAQLQDLYRRLAHSEQHLAELEQKRDTAWNDDFRERAQSWIDEEQGRISGLRERIERVEGWIEDDRERLRSAG
jgi:CII-binding regulator of phage lambda lysogenization HflD